MRKKLTISFAVLGYLVVIWYYATYFSAVSWPAGRAFLWNMCLSCSAVSGMRSGQILVALLLLGPINAVAYGAIGLVIGLLLSHFPRRRS